MRHSSSFVLLALLAACGGPEHSEVLQPTSGESPSLPTMPAEDTLGNSAAEGVSVALPKPLPSPPLGARHRGHFSNAVEPKSAETETSAAAPAFRAPADVIQRQGRYVAAVRARKPEFSALDAAEREKRTSALKRQVLGEVQ